MADAELFPADLWTNRAHAIMLHEQQITPPDWIRKLLDTLDTLEQDWSEGSFVLDPRLEDVHTCIEREVSRRAGEEIGGRLHTARSRNDQAACDMRLFLREALLTLGTDLIAYARTLLEQATAHTSTVMPGFTHHQPAMLSTWGHWLCAHAQAIERSLQRLWDTLRLLNRSPLGAAASFGSSWPIHRERTATLMGFDAVEENTLDCIAARWEHEAHAAQLYVTVMCQLASLAQDLILFTHPYWNLLRLPDAFVTGSSIMPQKRNPDAAEVIKGKAAWAIGAATSLWMLPKGNMSGYHRDTQWGKYVVLDLVRECAPAPRTMRALIAAAQPQPEMMRKRLRQGYLAAVDFADGLARRVGLPFRTCHAIAAEAVRRSGEHGVLQASAAAEALRHAGQDPRIAQELLQQLTPPSKLLAQRRHTGSPAAGQVRLHIRRLTACLKQHETNAAAWRDKLEHAQQMCRSYPEAAVAAAILERS